MRRAFTILFLIVLAARSGAQETRRMPGGQTSATARALIALENGWARGVVRRDTAMFRRLLHPRFVYTEDAVVMDKAELIKAIAEGDRVERAENSEMVVHDHGGTAVVTGILRLQGRGTSGAFDRRYRYTDTWMRGNGGWRMIAAQDYLLPR